MIGVAVAVQAPAKDAAVALLGDGVTGLDALPIVAAHDWELGGRR
jgi:hypothetical protein